MMCYGVSVGGGDRGGGDMEVRGMSTYLSVKYGPSTLLHLACVLGYSILASRIWYF